MRADAGPGIGAGHVARCLALAEAWRAAGGQALLASRDLPDWLGALAGSMGVGLVDPDHAAARDAEWWVLDGYRFGVADQRGAPAARVAVIDDHGAAGRYEADLVVDQNLGADIAYYADRAARTRLALGSRYTMVRHSVRAVAAARADRPADTPPERALVVLGGAPDADLLETVVGAVHAAGYEPLVAPGGADLAPLLARADVAVSAAGATVWELCACGVPAVVVPLAANQVPVAGRLAGAGAALDIGRPGADLEHRVEWALGVLRADASRRKAMATAAREACDGRGADRVVTALQATALAVRPAGAADCRRLWEWANDPATRAASYRSGPIGWEEHVSWFARNVADPASAMYVVEGDAGPIGQARFAVDAGHAEVSVSVDAGHRGGGTGAAVIRAATDQLMADRPLVRVVDAWIKATNAGSIGAFARAGWLEHHRGEHPSGYLSVQYRWARP